MRCPNCGKDIEEGNFCSACGQNMGKQDLFIKQQNKENYSYGNVKKIGGVFECLMNNILKGLFILFILVQIATIPFIITDILPRISQMYADKVENFFQYYQLMFMAIGNLQIIIFGILLIDILLITFGFILPEIKKIKSSDK